MESIVKKIKSKWRCYGRRALSLVLSLVVVVGLIPMMSTTSEARTSVGGNDERDVQLIIKRYGGFIESIAIANHKKEDTAKSYLTNNGYTVEDYDLNKNAGGDYIYIGCKRTKDYTKAITGIGLVSTSSKDAPADSMEKNGHTFYLVGGKYEPNGSGCGVVDLNENAGGKYIYMYITRDLSYNKPIYHLYIMGANKGKVVFPDEEDYQNGLKTAACLEGGDVFGIDLNDGATSFGYGHYYVYLYTNSIVINYDYKKYSSNSTQHWRPYENERSNGLSNWEYYRNKSDHTWKDGKCTTCGYKCEHSWSNSTCTNCGLSCSHKWVDGECKTCGKRCSHSWSIEDGTCTTCEYKCSHPSWNDGTCTVCKYVCPSHQWENGVCINCGSRCSHIYNDYGYCFECGNSCIHPSWNNGICTECGIECKHTEYVNSVCTTCGMGCSHQMDNGFCTICEYANFNYLDVAWNYTAGCLDSSVVSLHKINSTVTSTTTNWTDGWYVVNKDVTVDKRIYVNGTVKLLLCDGVTFNAANGIEVSEGNSLYIYSQSDDEKIAGTLNAMGAVYKFADTDPLYFPGIGALTDRYSNPVSGDIVINGGIINATGTANCPAIGPGDNMRTESTPSGRVIINGGTVTATSDNEGIRNVSSLQINGGNVYCSGVSSAKSSGGMPITCKEFTLNGVTEQTKIKSIKGFQYGTNDLYTINNNKLYLWFSSSKSVTAVYADSGVSYGPLSTSKYEDDTELYCRHQSTSYSVCNHCGEYITRKTPDQLSDDYYAITNAAELTWFMNRVRSGYTDIKGRLMKDIDMTAGSSFGIGTPSRPFEGIFDGDGYKITYSIKGGQYTALFPYVKGATIKNLTVDGKITATQKFAASIIGRSLGDVMLVNCMSTVNIESSVDGDGIHGGLVANVSGGSLTISNCGFMGSISGSNTTNCGGLVGWTGVAITIKNSFVSAKFSLKGGADSNTFSRNAGKVTVTNCYYLNAADKTSSDATKITDAQIKSGELAYKLNDQNGGVNWFQNIDNGATKDNHPVPNSTHGVVYYGYSDCADTEINYTNLKTSKSVQGHIYEGEANCLKAIYCQDCGEMIYDIDPEKHTSTETYIQYIDDNTHGEYHSCCNALISTQEHTVTSESNCTGVNYCSVCDTKYGSIDADNHTGEVVCEPKKYSNVYHEYKYNCCGAVTKTEEHNLEYTIDNDTMTITAVCTDCGATGSVTMSLESGVYNGYAFEAKYTATGIYSGWQPYSTPIFEYCCEDGCKRAGGHNVSMTLESHWLGGDSEDEKIEVDSATVYHSFSISKKQLKISEIKSWSKDFDNNAKIDIYGLTLDGVVVYDEGMYPFAWDDVTDNVDIDWDELRASVDSSAVGEYETANLTGIVLKGTDIDNYEIESEMTGVSLKLHGGSGNYSINKRWVTIMPEDQYLEGSNTALDQTAYELSDTMEGFTIEGIELKLDDYDRIYADCENIKVYTDDEAKTDVTDSFEFSSYYANYSYVCEGHTYNEDGFCATGTCNAYQPAVKNDNNTTDNTYDDYYEIWNVGQLYWFAQQVDDYSKTDIGGKLMADLTVNPGTFDEKGNYTPAGDEKLREWTPIANSNYIYYSGAFDGNGHTVSGLYCKSEDGYVGFFGSLGYYTVDNLHIKNSYFEGYYAGAIAGYSGATLNKCSAAADVYAKGTNAGGLIGNNNGTINNSYSLAKTSGDISSGLVGYNYGIIENCFTNDMQPVGHNSSYATLTNVYYGKDTRDYETPDENGFVAVKPEFEGATEVTNAEDFKSGKITYLLQQGVKGELIEYDKDDNPVYAEGEQIWYQTIDKQDWPSFSGDIVYYDEAADEYTNENPATVPSITQIEYGRLTADGFNQITVTLNGHVNKLQLIYPNGSTCTFNNYSNFTTSASKRGVVSVVAYDKDGNKVEKDSPENVLEVWVINVKLAEGEYQLRTKSNEKWRSTKNFTVEYDLTAEVESVKLNGTANGGFNKYTVKVNGSASKVQIAFANAGTYTFDRNSVTTGDSTRGVTSIKAYNKDGKEVELGSSEVAYEIWVLNMALPEGSYTAKAKFNNTWEENGKSFDVTYTTETLDEVKVVAVTGENGNYSFKLDGTAQKLQVIHSNGQTNTFAKSNASVKYYDANDNEVDEYSGDVAYEIWTVSKTFASGSYSVITKYNNGTAPVWGENGFALEVE